MSECRALRNDKQRPRKVIPPRTAQHRDGRRAAAAEPSTPSTPSGTTHFAWPISEPSGRTQPFPRWTPYTYYPGNKGLYLYTNCRTGRSLLPGRVTRLLQAAGPRHAAPCSSKGRAAPVQRRGHPAGHTGRRHLLYCTVLYYTVNCEEKNP